MNSQPRRARVLEIAGGWGLGGSEQAIQLRCLLLEKSRYEVMAVGLESGGPRLDSLRDRGISTEICHGDIAALEKVISEFQPHVLHYGRSSSYSKTIPEISRLAARYETAALVETNVFGRPGLESLERQPDLVAHMSGASFLKCARALGETSATMYAKGHTVVYLPVPATLYRDSPEELDKRQARASLGLESADFVACRVARPDIRKWSSILEVALPQLFGQIPNLKFVFHALPQEKERSLRRLFGDRIVCLEPTADIGAITRTYLAADVMIHSSGIGESFGLCLAEAMYFGLPVVVDSTPSLDNAQIELVSNKSTGFVVRSSAGFVDAARKLAEDRELLDVMGMRAREVALRYFVDSSIVEQWDELYTGLMPWTGEARQSQFSQPKALVVSEADYDQRCQQIWGPQPKFNEKVRRVMLRLKDTVKYVRQVGFSNLFWVILARLRAGRVTRS